MADNISFSSDDDDDSDDDYIGPSASASTHRLIGFLLSPRYTPMNNRTRTSLGPSPKDMADALFLSKQKRATAVCFKRNDGTSSVVHETTVFVEYVKGTTGIDLLNAAVKTSLEERSCIFQLGTDGFDADKDIIRYEFKGANPSSKQFQTLELETILEGEVDTVQILMSVTKKNEDYFDFDANATTTT